MEAIVAVDLLDLMSGNTHLVWGRCRPRPHLGVSHSVAVGHGSSLGALVAGHALATEFSDQASEGLVDLDV